MVGIRMCWEQLISPWHSCKLCKCYTRRGEQGVVCAPTVEVMEPTGDGPRQDLGRSTGHW